MCYHWAEYIKPDTSVPSRLLSTENKGLKFNLADPSLPQYYLSGKVRWPPYTLDRWSVPPKSAGSSDYCLMGMRAIIENVWPVKGQYEVKCGRSCLQIDRASDDRSITDYSAIDLLLSDVCDHLETIVCFYAFHAIDRFG